MWFDDVFYPLSCSKEYWDYIGIKISRNPNKSQYNPNKSQYFQTPFPGFGYRLHTLVARGQRPAQMFILMI